MGTIYQGKIRRVKFFFVKVALCNKENSYSNKGLEKAYGTCEGSEAILKKRPMMALVWMRVKGLPNWKW